LAICLMQYLKGGSYEYSPPITWLRISFL